MEIVGNDRDLFPGKLFRCSRCDSVGLIENGKLVRGLRRGG